MLQTEVITVSDKQQLMCSCHIDQTDAYVNSISGCSWTVFHICVGEKKIFSFLRQTISERESGVNICTTADSNNTAEKLVMQMAN